MFKAVLALTVMTVLGAALVPIAANAAPVLGPGGEPLVVLEPLRFFLHRSFPPALVGTIRETMDKANLEAGQKVAELSGVNLDLDAVKFDGVNTISYELENPNDMGEQLSVTTLHATEGIIRDVDIRLNGGKFDMENDPALVEQTLLRQIRTVYSN